MRPLQADPLGLVPGNNDYEWENDGPMDAADPSGLAEQPSIPIPAPWQPKPTELPPVPFGGLLLFPGVEFHAGQWLPDQFTLRGYGSLYFQDLLEFKFSQPLGYEYPELVFDYKNWLFGGNEESPLIVLDGYYKSLEDAHVNLGVKWDESHSFRLDYTSCGDEDILYTGGKWKTDYADLFFTFDYSFRNLNYKTVWNVGASKEFETPWGPFSYFIAASGDKGFGTGWIYNPSFGVDTGFIFGNRSVVYFRAQLPSGRFRKCRHERTELSRLPRTRRTPGGVGDARASTRSATRPERLELVAAAFGQSAAGAHARRQNAHRQKTRRPTRPSAHPCAAVCRRNAWPKSSPSFPRSAIIARRRCRLKPDPTILNPLGIRSPNCLP